MVSYGEVLTKYEPLPKNDVYGLRFIPTTSRYDPSIWGFLRVACNCGFHLYVRMADAFWLTELQQPALYQAAESRSGAVNKDSGASAQAPPRYSHWDSHDVMRRKHEKTKKRTKWTEVEKKNSRASLLFCGYSQPIWFCPKSSYANYSYKQLRLDSPLKSIKPHY